jgi:hypothetical protein
MLDIAHLREPALITEFEYPYLVKGVNAEWLRVCGFKSKEDVCGKKLDIIQGPLTDRTVVNQMMDTLHQTGRSQARLTNYRRTEDGMMEPFECDISIKEYKENLDDSDTEVKSFMCIMSPRDDARGVSFGSFVEEHPTATKQERREAMRVAFDTSYHHRLAFDKTLSIVPSCSPKTSLGGEQLSQQQAPHSSEPNWHESYSFGAFAAAEQLAERNSKRSRCERVKLFVDTVSQPAKNMDAPSTAAPSLPPPPPLPQPLSAPPHTTSASYGSAIQAAAHEGRRTSRAERREAMQRFLLSTRATAGHSRL